MFSYLLVKNYMPALKIIRQKWLLGNLLPKKKIILFRKSYAHRILIRVKMVIMFCYINFCFVTEINEGPLCRIYIQDAY